MEKIREEFEAWAVSFKNEHNIPLFVFYKEDGEYTCSDCRLAWSAWKASRTALCVEIPDPEMGNGNNISPVDVEIALDKAGVSYK